MMGYLITAYILNIIDYIFTSVWVHKFGIEIEANPFGRWMLENNVAWVVKILIVGGLFALIAFIGYFTKWNKKAIISTYILLAVHACVVVYHLIIAVRLIMIT